MKRLVVFSVVGLILVGCGGPAAKPIDRGHDAYSKTAEGKQAVESSDGRKVEVKTGADLASYGLKVPEWAKPPRDNAAYLETGETTNSTTYELTAEKGLVDAKTFYEKALGVKASIADKDQALVSGKLGDGRGAVVTILRTTPKEVTIKVQILEKAK